MKQEYGKPTQLRLDKGSMAAKGFTKIPCFPLESNSGSFTNWWKNWQRNRSSLPLTVFAVEFKKQQSTFSDCDFARKAWSMLPIKEYAISLLLNITSFETGLILSKNWVCPPPTGVVLGPIFPWLCWALWNAQNKLLFDGRMVSVEDCLKSNQGGSGMAICSMPNRKTIKTEHPPLSQQFAKEIWPPFLPTRPGTRKPTKWDSDGFP